MKEQIPIFVYGTLKRGFCNHHLIEHSIFVGRSITEELFALYVSGIPYVCKEEQVSPIYGELYLVDLDTLNSLDSLEGHPNWYRREQVSVFMKNGDSISSESVNAWLYFNKTPQGKLVSSGTYE